MSAKKKRLQRASLILTDDSAICKLNIVLNGSMPGGKEEDMSSLPEGEVNMGDHRSAWECVCEPLLASANV